MVFSSLIFLFRFLPAVLLLYFISPRRLRNLVLLIVSLFFYAWGEPVYIILMLVSIMTSYLGGLFIGIFQSRGRDRAAKVSSSSPLLSESDFLVSSSTRILLSVRLTV